MIHFRRWLPQAIVGTSLLSLTACGGSASGDKGGASAKPDPVIAVQIGAALLPKSPVPEIESQTTVAEPVIIQQATIAFDDKIALAAQVDGNVELIGTPLPPGATLSPDDSTIIPHPRDPKMLFRKLRDNVPVALDQILARLDESQIAIQYEGLVKSAVAAGDRVKASRQVVLEAQNVLDRMKNAGGVSAVELANAQAAVARSQEGVAEAVTNLVKLEAERDLTRKKLDLYWVKSTVEGRIYKVIKNPGEFAKAGETILEVQGTARFRVEGTIDVQDASRLKLNQPVVVEPTRPLGPEPYSARHRQAVTGVAVTAHPGRPLVVSTGMDGTTLVWDVTKTRKTHALPHPQGLGVRAVATTGTKAQPLQLAATGATDGKIRLWDLGDPDQLPGAPSGIFEDSHTSPVSSLDFAPDGKYLATAAGREVFIWDVSSRKKRYSLPLEHKDDVSAVRFTPQGTLLTVARDKSIRIWNLGVDGAALDKTLDSRNGAVDVLGLSTDGSRVLFDQDPGRLDLVSLADGRTVGSLFNTGGTFRFAGLALFSPDDELILSAGADAESRGELQLWEKPPVNGRGAERRRLVTPGRSPVTCAAFSPDPEKRFVVVGTQGGGVNYWLSPSAGEMNKSWRGKIVSITKNDARTATVRVEVDNPGGRSAEWLQDRGTATIIIDPTAKPEPTRPEAARVPMGGQPAVPVIPAGARETLVAPLPMLPAGVNVPVFPDKK